MGDPQNDWFIEKMPLKWMMTGGSPSLANHQMMLVPLIPLGTEKALRLGLSGSEDVRPTSLDVDRSIQPDPDVWGIRQ